MRTTWRIALALGFVLGGSLLTEIVFSYPGQGYLLIQAVRAQDYPLMQGIFLLIAGTSPSSRDSGSSAMHLLRNIDNNRQSPRPDKPSVRIRLDRTFRF